VLIIDHWTRRLIFKGAIMPEGCVGSERQAIWLKERGTAGSLDAAERSPGQPGFRTRRHRILTSHWHIGEKPGLLFTQIAAIATLFAPEPRFRTRILRGSRDPGEKCGLMDSIPGFRCSSSGLHAPFVLVADTNKPRVVGAKA